jgi:hypothetical protein
MSWRDGDASGGVSETAPDPISEANTIRTGEMSHWLLPLLVATGSLVDIHLNPIEFLFDDVKGMSPISPD